MFPIANIMGFGNPVEIAIIAGVVVLLFGGSKLAGFGKHLGDGIKEFKKATRDEEESTPTTSTSVTSAPVAPTVVSVGKTDEK